MKFNKVEAHYSLVEEKENNNIGDDTLGASDKELKYRRPNFDERECPYRTNSIKEEITSQVVYVPLDIFNTVTLLLSIITLLFIFDLYLRFRDVQNGDLYVYIT